MTEIFTCTPYVSRNVPPRGAVVAADQPDDRRSSPRTGASFLAASAAGATLPGQPQKADSADRTDQPCCFGRCCPRGPGPAIGPQPRMDDMATVLLVVTAWGLLSLLAACLLAGCVRLADRPAVAVSWTDDIETYLRLHAESRRRPPGRGPAAEL